MNKKTKLGLISAIILFTALAGLGIYFLLFPRFKQDQLAGITPDQFFGWKYPSAKFPSVGTGNQLAYSDIRDPGGVPQGLPVRLRIPIIGVDSAIEDALITPDGRMDVPAGSVNVAWFALGPHPGQKGSAVIGGHFGIKNGVPFVFYKLDQLKTGDKINIIDDGGATLTFVVRSIALFDRSADATTVFTSSDGLAHLNLITCEGVWNQVNGSYPQRRVVFTDLVTSAGVADVLSIKKAEDVSASTFLRSLVIGSKGSDVSALQTILEQKGFLTMPRGIAKGYFGSLTGAAVAKYQGSVGISPVGSFGPLTRAKLSLELANKPALPNTAIIPNAENISSTVGSFTQLLRSLYATPLDGITTSVLAGLIILLVVKIIL